jgi:hypothetical protein
MPRAKRKPAEPTAPMATWGDATVVVEVANAGVEAIIAAAARHGLEDGYWSAEQLYPRVAEIIAVALRRTPDWWRNRNQGEV